jgi:hypothetical protein
MIHPTGAAPGDGGGNKEEGDNAKTPLAQLMGWGNRVQLLQLFGLEDEWEHTRQEERRDGEWGRRHGRRALSLGVCLCKEKKEEGRGMAGGVPSNNNHSDNQCNDWPWSSPLSMGGEDIVSALPGPDALERRAQLLDAIVVGGCNRLVLLAAVGHRFQLCRRAIQRHRWGRRRHIALQPGGARPDI